jgi:DNA mismatch repair protein MutS
MPGNTHDSSRIATGPEGGSGDVAVVTPMRRQYLELKARHPGAILFFRLGDFYETFDDDAETCARLLQITLTGREMGRGVRVPMAGVPAHAVGSYLARLVAQGRTVAVCEQVDDSRVGGPARAMMTREVTRVVTPGTVVETAMLYGGRNNYLLAIVAAPNRARASRGSSQTAERHSAPPPTNPMPTKSLREGEEYGDYAWGLAYSDVSTGEFRCTQIDGPDADAELRREIARISPAECLVPRSPRIEADAEVASVEERACDGLVTTRWDEWRFEMDTASEALKRRFGVATLAGYGLDGLPLATRAAGALVAYLDKTHGGRAPALDSVATYAPGNFVRLDPFTRRNLELDVPSRGSGPSLLGAIDETRTAIGARLLRRWLGQPLVDVQAISARHDAVGALVADGGRRGTIRGHLGSIADIERIANRATQGGATPRELHALRRSLALAAEIAGALRQGAADEAAALADGIDPCFELQSLIERAIHEEDPGGQPRRVGPSAADHGIRPLDGASRGKGDPLAAEQLIRPGYSNELDALVAGVQDARRWIARLEVVERERTGISTIRVGYNRVFGYYIHVPTRFGDRVPSEYIRRQTLADGERYVTPELKAKEDIVVQAASEIEKAERTAYDGVLSVVASYGARLRVTAAALARIDVVAGLAEVAVRRGYVRPEVDETVGLEIRDGRHPVVETTFDGGGGYVPNDCVVDADDRWAVILTGPNMAGKSTFLRSVALIVLMAQVGSFVPAASARIGLVDRVFTRVGAHDDLAAGRSTFMVEMVEAAQILHHATRRSLVILDEIGRGTSTHDGLAIAQAVVEFLHHREGADGGGDRPRTLFATHYHELSSLENSLPGVVNARLEVLEEGSRVTFLHRVVPGAAGRSYGIHVARLAGMPRAVTDRAALLLGALEARSASAPPPETPEVTDRGLGWNAPSHGSRDVKAQRVVGTTTRDGVTQLTLFAPPTHPVAEALQALDIDGLTPREALNTLARLRAMVSEG